MVKYKVGDAVTYGHTGRRVTHVRREGQEAVILAVQPDGLDQYMHIQFKDGFVHGTWNNFVQPLVRSGPW